MAAYLEDMRRAYIDEHSTCYGKEKFRFEWGAVTHPGDIEDHERRYREHCDKADRNRPRSVGDQLLADAMRHFERNGML